MFWFAVAFAAVFVIAYNSIPSPQGPQAGTFEAPTAEEGRPIPVLFGTRRISSANIVWWGDLRTEAVKKSGGKK